MSKPCPHCLGNKRVGGPIPKGWPTVPQPLVTCPTCHGTGSIPEGEKWPLREADGRYGYNRDFGRLCVCGHALAVHSASNDTSKRPCFNEDTGIEGATGEPCDCQHFKLQHPTPPQEAGDELRRVYTPLEIVRFIKNQSWGGQLENGERRFNDSQAVAAIRALVAREVEAKLDAFAAELRCTHPGSAPESGPCEVCDWLDAELAHIKEKKGRDDKTNQENL